MSRVISIFVLLGIIAGALAINGCTVTTPPIPLSLSNLIELDPDPSIVAEIPGQAQGYVYVPSIARRQTGNVIYVTISSTPPGPGDQVPVGAVITIQGQSYTIGPDGFFQVILTGYTEDTVQVSIDFSNAPGFENAQLDPDSQEIPVDYTGFAELRVDASQLEGYDQVIERINSIRSATLEAEVTNGGVEAVTLGLYLSDTQGLTLEQIRSATASQDQSPLVYTLLSVQIPVGTTTIEDLPVQNLDQLLAELDPNSDRQFSLYGVATPRIRELTIRNVVLRLSANVRVLQEAP